MALCGKFAVLQTPGFGRFMFDPFSLPQNGFVASEAGAGQRDVFQALMIPLMIVVIGEGLDLGFKIAR